MPETGENMHLFVFISSFLSSGARIYVQYFSDTVRNKNSNKKYLLVLIKRRSKVHKKIMSQEHALNCEQ